jgi:Ras-related protein Rab-6A
MVAQPPATASSAAAPEGAAGAEAVATTLPGLSAAGAAASQGGARLKVIVLGDQAVGKSSIVARFMYDAYDRHYRATLGIDFLTKLVTVDGRTVRLQLWDTAGTERFRSLIPAYIRNSAGAIVVFDVTSRESFINTTRWIDDVRQERGEDSGIVFFLVGNKIDLGEKRAVTTEEGEARAREIGAAYCEVSAKTGANIKQLFRRVSTTIPLPPGDDTAAGASASPSVSLAPMRRLDPLLITPSRMAGAAARRDGDPSGGGGAAGAPADAAAPCGSC